MGILIHDRPAKNGCRRIEVTMDVNRGPAGHVIYTPGIRDWNYHAERYTDTADRLCDSLDSAVEFITGQPMRSSE